MSTGKKDATQLAESHERLYQPLPESVSGQIGVKVIADATAEVKDFLKARLPSTDHKEIDDEFKKIQTLYKQKGKNWKNQKKKMKKKEVMATRKSRKLLTARERRDLHLHKLPKKGGLRYKDFAEVHALWQSYIAGLVSMEKVRAGDDQAKTRLCRADLHGARVKVTRARASNQVGLEGFVAQETRNTLALLGEDDVVRTVPKMESSFSMEVGGFLVTLGGSTMCMKPSDRAVKKWKRKPPYEL